MEHKLKSTFWCREIKDNISQLSHYINHCNSHKASKGAIKMLWHCSTFMSQIQNQDLQGHNICYISAFLTDIPLQKPNGTQDIQ